MSRSARSAALRAASLSLLAMFAAAAIAQKPQKPLGELLDVIPLPEERAPEPSDSAPPAPAAPAARPGDVLPVELPPSAATGEIATDEELATTVETMSNPKPGDPAAADAAARADRTWADLQEQRRQKVNSVEAPIVAGLNAEMAARAEADGRRFAAEQEAYERSLVERQEEIRRREAEHEAAMAEHARRVAREQAEYRARVEACRRDRRDCDF